MSREVHRVSRERQGALLARRNVIVTLGPFSLWEGLTAAPCSVCRAQQVTPGYQGTMIGINCRQLKELEDTVWTAAGNNSLP